MSGHVAERPDPPKSGSDCLHDCFPDGCEGVERGLGSWRDMVGRGDGGREGGEGSRDLGRKGKCGSTQSKPCHMFQSAGIWPPVQTRMLCKRLLIRESARRKTECQSGGWGILLVCLPQYCHMVSQRGKRTWVLLEVQTDPMSMRFWGKMKQKIWNDMNIYPAGVKEQALALCYWEKESAWEWPVSSNSYHLSLTHLLSKSPYRSDVIPFTGHSSAGLSPSISFNSLIIFFFLLVRERCISVTTAISRSMRRTNKGVWKEWRLDQTVWG